MIYTDHLDYVNNVVCDERQVLINPLKIAKKKKQQNSPKKKKDGKRVYPSDITGVGEEGQRISSYVHISHS